MKWRDNSFSSMGKIFIHVSSLVAVLAFVAMMTFSSCSPEQRGVDTGETAEIVDGREFVTSLGMHASNLPLSDLRSGGVEDIKQIQHMRILVFDEDQKFLYTADAVLGEDHTTSPTDASLYLPDGKRDKIEVMRSFEVKLVESSKPRYLHFVVDYGWKNFSQDYFLKGTSAGELMTQLHTKLEVANGNSSTKAFSPMWSIVRVDKLNKRTLEGKVIKLLRNYAKIQLQVADGVKATDRMTIDGYCIANSLNKGMVVSFRVQNYKYEFPFKITEATVPADAEFLPTPTDDDMITPDKTFNLFESKNDHETKKMCVIIRGTKSGETRKRYYKIDLVSRKNELSVNEYIQILRNNWYVINISRIKSEGYSSLEDALKAPADNNVFASVELKDFSKVSDGTYYLDVNPIQMVIVKPGTYSFNTIFNGKRDYTRFYPNWTAKDDLLMGDWNKTTSTDPMQTTFTFTVDRIPADNIEEYKVEVVGLRYANKSGLNPGDPGYDSNAKSPVIDGVSGATTPITRTVHITLRSPYLFNAKLEDDPSSNVTSDMILSFEVYTTIPQTLLPLEVLIEARDITPRNKGGASSADLMIVEREVEENGVQKKKLFYRYTLTPEAYKVAIDGDRRIKMPVTINDGTATLSSDITLMSELYRSDIIYGAKKPRENSFELTCFLPDGSSHTIPSASEDSFIFKLDDQPNVAGIKLISVDGRGKFRLQITDKNIRGTQKLEVSTWLTSYNDYGYFMYLVKRTMTVAEWLGYTSSSVRLEGASVHVKGFLLHYNNGYATLRPTGVRPMIWGTSSYTGFYTDLTDIANYKLSDAGRYVNGEYGYDFEFTIPESTYRPNANGYFKWTGIGFGYHDKNKYPAQWKDLQNSGKVSWYY